MNHPLSMELDRLEALVIKAQEIYLSLVIHPNLPEVEPILVLAEQLRERLREWARRERLIQEQQ